MIKAAQKKETILEFTRTRKGLKTPFYCNADTGLSSFELSDVASANHALIPVVNKSNKIQISYAIEVVEEGLKLSIFGLKNSLKDFGYNNFEATAIITKDKEFQVECFCDKDSKSTIVDYSYYTPGIGYGSPEVNTDITGAEVDSEGLRVFKRLFCPYSFHMQYVGANDLHSTLDKVFSSVFFGGGNDAFFIKDYNDLYKMLIHKECLIKETPRQKKIDVLTAATKTLSTDDIKTIIKPYQQESKDRWSRSTTFSIIEKVDVEEPTCVLRTFIRDWHNNSLVGETSRIYFTGKEVLPCKQTNTKNYVASTLFQKASSWKNFMIDFDKEVAQGTRLNYIASCIDDFDDEAKSLAIWAFTKWPIFETLHKSGYSAISIVAIEGLSINNMTGTGRWRNFTSPMEALSFMFSPADIKGKKLFNALGCNKYQLDCLNKIAIDIKSQSDELKLSLVEEGEKFDYSVFHDFNDCVRARLSMVAYVKGLIEDVQFSRYSGLQRTVTSSIQDMDNDTFDLFLKMFNPVSDVNTLGELMDNIQEVLNFTYDNSPVSAISHPEMLRLANSSNWRDEKVTSSKYAATVMAASEVFRHLYTIGGINAIIKMLPKVDAMSQITIDSSSLDSRSAFGRYCSGYSSFATKTYSDYLDMSISVQKANTDLRIDYDFDSVEDIIDMHNNILSIYNAVSEQVDTIAFDNRRDFFSKFEYEGKEFSVIAPQKASEIGFEGISLRHCVKSYIKKVVNGYTNILFVRRNDDLENPFFTIELTNDKELAQAHGFCNSNASSEEGLPEFLDEWTTKFNIKKNNYNVMR